MKFICKVIKYPCTNPVKKKLFDKQNWMQFSFVTLGANWNRKNPLFVGYDCDTELEIVISFVTPVVNKSYLLVVG